MRKLRTMLSDVASREAAVAVCVATLFATLAVITPAPAQAQTFGEKSNWFTTTAPESFGAPDDADLVDSPTVQPKVISPTEQAEPQAVAPSLTTTAPQHAAPAPSPAPQTGPAQSNTLPAPVVSPNVAPAAAPPASVVPTTTPPSATAAQPAAQPAPVTAPQIAPSAPAVQSVDPTAAAAPSATTAPPAPVAPAVDPAMAAAATVAVRKIPDDVRSTIKDMVDVMEASEKRLSDIDTANTDLGEVRSRIDKVITNTTRTADSLRPQLADINRQIEKLGPAPTKDAPPEAASAATERVRLAAEAAEVSGAIKTLEVTWWRARQAIEKITDLRLKLFVQSLTQRMTSPLLPELWDNLMRDLPDVSWRVGYNIDDIANAIGRQSGSVLTLLLAAAVMFLVLRLLVARIISARPDDTSQPLTFFQRAAFVAWTVPVRMIPASAAALTIYFGFHHLGLLYFPTAAPVGVAMLRAVLIFIAVASLLASVFAPRNPFRRLVQLSNDSAWRICRLLQTLAALYALDLFLSAVGQIIYVPLSVSVVQSLFTSLLFAAVLTGLLFTRIQPFVDGVRPPVSMMYPRSIKIPLAIAIITIVIVSLIGYVALGRFLAQQILITGVIGLIGILLYLAIRAFTRDNGQRSAASLFLESQLGFDDTRRRQFGWVTETVLTFAVGLMLLPLLLLQWGFSAADIRDWFSQLIFGFQVGSIRISLARILLGIGIFVGLLLLTRMIQRRIRENVLIQPRMDPGIANSIDTALGYLGIALAAIIAVSYAGFDITNLAIVAGALSVGIGFGLQSIVNNFVSGLILLIERPIKVGDWIVVGTEEGIVKRISVRSTEIETFNRASLIVPNSELIAGRVLNWTHRTAMGRIVLPLNAGIDADPHQVIAILKEVAEANTDILRKPPPAAIFEGYTATATEFTLRAFVPDINSSLGIKSELRMAVFAALKRNHIDMPVTMAVKTGQAIQGHGAD